MNGDALQRSIDRARGTSRQRWVLGVVALVAAIAASASANVAAREGSVFLLGLVVVLALASVVEPDSHTGTWVVLVVVGQWGLVVDDITTPVAVVAAVCLLVFHSVVALMALMPPSATVDTLVLGRWAARALAAVGGTVAMWALVATFDRWQLPGGAALTVTGFVVLATGVTALLAALVPMTRTCAGGARSTTRRRVTVQSPSLALPQARPYAHGARSRRLRRSFPWAQTAPSSSA